MPVALSNPAVSLYSIGHTARSPQLHLDPSILSTHKLDEPGFFFPPYIQLITLCQTVAWLVKESFARKKPPRPPSLAGLLGPDSPLALFSS